MGVGTAPLLSSDDDDSSISDFLDSSLSNDDAIDDSTDYPRVFDENGDWYDEGDGVGDSDGGGEDDGVGECDGDTSETSEPQFTSTKKRGRDVSDGVTPSRSRQRTSTRQTTTVTTTVTTGDGGSDSKSSDAGTSSTSSHSDERSASSSNSNSSGDRAGKPNPTTSSSAKKKSRGGGGGGGTRRGTINRGGGTASDVNKVLQAAQKKVPTLNKFVAGVCRELRHTVDMDVWRYNTKTLGIRVDKPAGRHPKALQKLMKELKFTGEGKKRDVYRRLVYVALEKAMAKPEYAPAHMTRGLFVRKVLGLSEKNFEDISVKDAEKNKDLFNNDLPENRALFSTLCVLLDALQTKCPKVFDDYKTFMTDGGNGTA